MDEILKYALDSGMIDLSYVQEQIMKKENQKILQNHPYKKWRGNDNYWRTYLPMLNGKRRLIKKKNEEDLNNVIIEYWKNISGYSFYDRYNVWVERQIACGRSGNTISKYKTDYNRFFKGDPFESMNVKNIKDTDIGEFIMRLLTNKEIYYRALKSMFGYMKGTFKKCVIDGIIDKNPCDLIDLPIYKKYCKEENIKMPEERTVSINEKKQILDKFHKNQTIPKFAVELAMYTGMRVGELAGLKWEDIDLEKRIITIRHSEKYDRESKQYYISITKNQKVRRIPLTDEMKNVLFNTKKFEIRNGWLGEFVFSDNNGRVHCRTISDCMQIATKTQEFKNKKSIHALRRTLNSNMRCNGVPAIVAAGILGHSERVNNDNYTYDLTSMDQKSDIIKDAGMIS